MQYTQYSLLKNKHSSLYLLFVFLVMSTSSVVVIEPAPVDIGLIFLFASGLVFQKLKFSFSKYYIAFFSLYLFVIASLISMFELPHMGVGMRDFSITIYLILSWLLYIGIIERYGKKGINALLYGYIVAAFLTATIAIMTYFNIVPGQDFSLGETRIRGWFKDPNVFGPFLIPIAIYSYSILEHPKKSKKLIGLIILVTLSLGIFLSFSRAAWGNFALSFVIYSGLSFLIRPSLRVVGKFLLAIILLIVVIGYILSIPSVNEIFIERFNYQQYDNDRFSNQAVALIVGVNNPLGIGPGQYQEQIGYATHNTFLRVLSENGIIGIIGYIGFILATLYRCFKIILRTRNPFYIVILASALGLVFNSLVVDTLHWRHFWFIFAIPWAYKLSSKKQNSDSSISP